MRLVKNIVVVHLARKATRGLWIPKLDLFGTIELEPAVFSDLQAGFRIPSISLPGLTHLSSAACLAGVFSHIWRDLNCFPFNMAFNPWNGMAIFNSIFFNNENYWNWIISPNLRNDRYRNIFQAVLFHFNHNSKRFCTVKLRILKKVCCYIFKTTWQKKNCCAFW